jgi:hypothetical protein
VFQSLSSFLASITIHGSFCFDFPRVCNVKDAEFAVRRIKQRLVTTLSDTKQLAGYAHSEMWEHAVKRYYFFGSTTITSLEHFACTVMVVFIRQLFGYVSAFSWQPFPVTIAIYNEFPALSTGCFFLLRFDDGSPWDVASAAALSGAASATGTATSTASATKEGATTYGAPPTSS